MKTILFILPLFLLLQCYTPKDISTSNKEKSEPQPKMAMYKTSWLWLNTTAANKKIEPRQKGKFTIKFDKERLDITTDCNGVSAFYQIENNQIKLSEFISTKMYCVNSQESEFTNMLRLSEKYDLSNNNTILKITLTNGSSMFFENMEK